MEIPDFFTDKQKLLIFDYFSLRDLIGSEMDHSTLIEDLSPLIKKELLLERHY